MSTHIARWVLIITVIAHTCASGHSASSSCSGARLVLAHVAISDSFSSAQLVTTDRDVDPAALRAPGSVASRRRSLALESKPKKLTSGEKGAMIGALLLSPAGPAGALMGASLGGSTGYICGRMKKAGKRMLRKMEVCGVVEPPVTDQHSVEQGEAVEKLIQTVPTQINAEVGSSHTMVAKSLESMRQDRHNQFCADCKFGMGSPDWASVNLGVFLCTRCASIHKSFPDAVSHVASLLYDQWTPDMTSSLMERGNLWAEGVYESHVQPPYSRPPPSANNFLLRNWISAKYVDKLFSQPPPHLMGGITISQRERMPHVAIGENRMESKKYEKEWVGTKEAPEESQEEERQQKGEREGMGYGGDESVSATGDHYGINCLSSTKEQSLNPTTQLFSPVRVHPTYLCRSDLQSPAPRRPFQPNDNTTFPTESHS